MGDMTNRDSSNHPAPPIGPLGANQPAPPVGPLAAAHERHDRLLVAAYASDDLDGAARTAAAELVAGCSVCADLATDLRTLARATHDLPPARRPRDFFLTPADAERLRPRGLRRLLAAFAAPTLPIRPLAAGLTTLGVAGLLLASLPGILPLGGAASSPMLNAVGDSVAPGEPTGAAPPAAPSAAPSAEPEPAAEGEHSRDTSGGSDDITPGSGSGGTPSGGPDTAGGETPEDGGGTDDGVPGSGGTDDGVPGSGGTDDGVRADSDDDGAQGELLSIADEGAPSVLVVVSGSFLIVGLGLFALRWAGRRLGSG
jgi:hypothetical protein